MLDWLPDNAVQCAKLSDDIKLRDPVEVHNLEDLFYCAHNAVRSAQQGSETAPPEFDPIVNGGCIHERRHALTWVLSPGVEWDDTDLSTQFTRFVPRTMVNRALDKGAKNQQRSFKNTGRKLERYNGKLQDAEDRQ